MNDNQRKVIIGGLLHDIGKVLYRSDDSRNHSQSGYDFLKNDVDIKDQDIYKRQQACVKYSAGY